MKQQLTGEHTPTNVRCCGQPANKGFVWLYWFHILEIIGFLVGFIVPILTLISFVRAFAGKIVSTSINNAGAFNNMNKMNSALNDLDKMLSNMDGLGGLDDFSGLDQFTKSLDTQQNKAVQDSVSLMMEGGYALLYYLCLITFAIGCLLNSICSCCSCCKVRSWKENLDSQSNRDQIRTAMCCRVWGYTLFMIIGLIGPVACLAVLGGLVASLVAQFIVICIVMGIVGIGLACYWRGAATQMVNEPPM